MTLAEARKKARKVSKAKARTVYVVFEAGVYDWATGHDLDTFYNGISPNHIIEAYENGEISP